MTAPEPLIAGNTVLPPGTYVWKLLEAQSNRNIVEVTDRATGHVETTIIALPAYRREISGTNDIQFWETPKGIPKAVRTWFYPGDNYGQEFVYPTKLVASLTATAANQTSFVHPSTARPGAEQPRQLASVRMPQLVPQPVPAKKSSPQPDSWAVISSGAGNSAKQAQSPKQSTGIWDKLKHLPLTATIAPLIGLIGLGCLALVLMSYLKRRSASQALQ